MKRALMILLSFLLVVPTYADMDRYSRAISEEFHIHYRFDRTDIDPEYRDNRNSTELLKQHLQNASRIDSIIIHVYSSPDGVYEYNARLARQRAAAAETLIRQLTGNAKTNAQTSTLIRTVIVAENWSGLQRLVQERYTRHDRSKVLDILEAENISEATRKWRLQQLDNGYTWNYMLRHYMPELRNATVITLRMKPEDPLPTLVPMCTRAVTMNPDDGPIRPKPAAEPTPSGTQTIQPTPEQQPTVTPADGQTEAPISAAKPSMIPLYALRTNLLVPALNIGAEVPLGERWSVSADYYYPWIWPSKMNRNCFELLGWSVEGRYWFGNDRQPQQRLRGHSVGLYAAAGYYDFERNYQGQQGEFVSTGLDYTYAMGIGRRKRLNLEFTLALGYIRSWGRNYTVPGPGGELYPEPGTVIFDYVGPTKAAVSLVVPFEKWPWTKAAMTGKTKAGKAKAVKVTGTGKAKATRTGKTEAAKVNRTGKAKATKTGRTRKEGRR